MRRVPAFAALLLLTSLPVHHVAAAEPERGAGLDRRREPRPRRESAEHLIDQVAVRIE